MTGSSSLLRPCRVCATFRGRHNSAPKARRRRPDRAPTGRAKAPPRPSVSISAYTPTTVPGGCLCGGGRGIHVSVTTGAPQMESRDSCSGGAGAGSPPMRTKSPPPQVQRFSRGQCRIRSRRRGHGSPGWCDGPSSHRRRGRGGEDPGGCGRTGERILDATLQKAPRPISQASPRRWDLSSIRVSRAARVRGTRPR